jgi:hypothetical protein
MSLARLAKTLAIAILLTGSQVCGSISVQAQFKKDAAKYFQNLAEELARRGLEAQFDRLKAYVTQNQMQNPPAQLAQRLKACKSGSQDRICELLLPPQ